MNTVASTASSTPRRRERQQLVKERVFSSDWDNLARFSPTTDPQSSTPIHRADTPNKPHQHRSSEHIDVILDMILEDKSQTDDSCRVKSPPVPPKPDSLSSHPFFVNHPSVAYSTLPTKKQQAININKTPTTPTRVNTVLSNDRISTPKLRPTLAKSDLPSHEITPTSLANEAVAVLASRVGGGRSSRESGSVLFRAVYDCKAEKSDELSFHRNELIQLVSRDKGDWWEGFIKSQPWRKGMFPSNYVIPVRNDEDQSPSS